MKLRMEIEEISLTTIIVYINFHSNQRYFIRFVNERTVSFHKIRFNERFSNKYYDNCEIWELE